MQTDACFSPCGRDAGGLVVTLPTFVFWWWPHFLTAQCPSSPASEERLWDVADARKACISHSLRHLCHPARTIHL